MEALMGYLRLAVILNECGSRYSGSYNFGPNLENTLSVYELANLFIKEWGKIKLRLKVKAEAIMMQ